MIWPKRLLRLVEEADSRFDRLKLSVKLRYGLLGPVYILPYRGHGTPQEMRLMGRVLEEKAIRLSEESDTALQNLRAMIRRFLSAEVPGARIRVRFGGEERVVTADGEGFFDVRLEPREPLPGDLAWREVELELLWPKARGQGEVRATGEVLVPPPRGATFGVISDVDDTIVRTEVTNLLTMLRLVLFSNVHTRLPFEGVAAFYRALRTGSSGAAHNPIFYVSTGPWNLYDLLVDFLRLRDLPPGPVFLRDWGGLKDLLRGADPREHKLGAIREILDVHPTLPFVLVGDSGQEDAEIYARIAREHPGRVHAIYIRQVGRAEHAGAVREIAVKMHALNVPMLLAPDTVAAAEHAAARGLISASALPEIRQEKREDARGSLL